MANQNNPGLDYRSPNIGLGEEKDCQSPPKSSINRSLEGSTKGTLRVEENSAVSGAVQLQKVLIPLSIITVLLIKLQIIQYIFKFFS